MAIPAPILLTLGKCSFEHYDLTMCTETPQEFYFKTFAHGYIKRKANFYWYSRACTQTQDDNPTSILSHSHTIRITDVATRLHVYKYKYTCLQV